MLDGEFERQREREYFVDEATTDAARTSRWVASGTLGGDDDIVLEGRVDEPVEEILEEAERRVVRFLVIGGRKRTSVGKAVFGSVTQSVLLEADQPVVTVMSQGE